MHRCLITCAMLLAGCGPDLPTVAVMPAPVPADLLMPPPGWQGPTPRTEGELILAAATEKRGRLQCTAQLATIDQILNP